MPIGRPSYSPAPKSGCGPVANPIEATYASELGWARNVSMRAFQMLSAGKSGHPAGTLPQAAQEPPQPSLPHAFPAQSAMQLVDEPCPCHVFALLFFLFFRFRLPLPL